MQKIPLPSAFVSRINQQFGESSAAFLASLEEASVPSIRLNSRKLHLELDLPKVSWCPQGYFTPLYSVFALDPWWHAGAFYVQEASSMFLHTILQSLNKSLKEPLVLDLCAAPGGKSTLLLDWLQQVNGFLVANEVVSNRLAILKENVMRWGAINYTTAQRDAAFWGKHTEMFDLILVDAPCSGEGMFRKDHKARLEWSEENAHHCGIRQDQILEEVQHALKPGGFLIYATCTFNPFENERVIQRLVANGWSLVAVELPDNLPQIATTHNASFHFLPHLVKGEGFFVSVLQKPGTNVDCEEEDSIEEMFPVLLNESPLPGFNPKPNIRFFRDKDEFYAVDSNLVQHYQALKKVFPITFLAKKIGQAKGQLFVPDHQLAMIAHEIFEQPEMHELEFDQAIKYLRKEDPGCKLPEGYQLVAYKKVALGWVKALPNRNNNLLPASLRLVKQQFNGNPLLSANHVQFV